MCALLNDALTLCRVPAPANCARRPHCAALLLSIPGRHRLPCAISLCEPVALWMASSFTERHMTSRAPPPADQLTAFYKLADKSMIASVLCRHACAVDLAAQAAVEAAALFGGDSLVLADLQMVGSENLSCSALDAKGADQEALYRQSWALLLSALPIFLRRLDAGTLLPGTVWDEKVSYQVHAQAVVKKARNKSAAAPAIMLEAGSAMGYNLLVRAAFTSRNHLMHPHPSWPAAERRSVEVFVFQALDVIPRTAWMPAGFAPFESHVVALIEQRMNPRHFEPAFCASVLRKWRSEAVSSVLRARGVLQTGIASCEENKADLDARQRADVAKHGLRDCALPSCAKTETTVKEFAGCSGCRSVVYCCLEHQALHWRAHKKACREMEAARLATEEGDTGGGASAG